MVLVFKLVVWRIPPLPTPPWPSPSFPIFCSLPNHLWNSCLAYYFLLRGGSSTCFCSPLLIQSLHSHVAAGSFLFFSIDVNVFIWCSCTPPPPPISPHISPPFPSSLCILDHFLSFQVSGPVEADYPSPGGAGPPHCLRGVSLSLCSRYAHSPHPVCVGGWGRGAGRPQVGRRGHLLQQQTLTVLLVSYTRHHTHTHTHLYNMHYSTGSQQHVSIRRWSDRRTWMSEGRSGGGWG